MKSSKKPIAAKQTPAGRRRHRRRSVPAQKPIFCLGFPKCATSSLTSAFLLTDRKVFHETSEAGLSLGELFVQARKSQKPLLEYCDYSVFTQMEHSGYDTKTPFFPQIDCLDVLIAQYPNALYIYQWRPFKAWWKSVVTWAIVPTWEKWPISRITNFPSTPEGIKAKWNYIYDAHAANCRAKFQNKKNFLWLDITKPNETLSKKLQKFCNDKRIILPHKNSSSNQKVKMVESDGKVYLMMGEQVENLKS